MPLLQTNGKLGGVFGRSSPRERRLLLLLGIALLAAAPVKAAQMMQEAAAQRESTQTELDRLRKAVGRNASTEKLASMRGEVRSWSWQAETVDIGKVLVQGQVAEFAKKAGLDNVGVTVADKFDMAGDIRLIHVEAQSDFSWSGLSSFFATMESSGKGFIVDSVQMTDGDKPRLKVEMRALLTLTPAAPTGGNP